MSSNRYIAPFFYAPATSTPYPKPLSPQQIVLYEHDKWDDGDFLEIQTGSGQYPDNRPFSFAGTKLNDKATWLAYNLPVGMVCTLFEHPMKSSGENYNFSGVGVCVDLIGTGQIETIDLKKYGAADCLSGGICRWVDANLGWMQLFRDIDCSGPFNTLFFGEWSTTETHSLSGWWMDKAASSVNYPSLLPPQLAILSENTEGTGQQVSLGASNPFGIFSNEARINLTNDGMNDKVRSFSYATITPKKTQIDSLKIGPEPASVGDTYENRISEFNRGAQPLPVSFKVAEEKSTSITCTTTLEYSMSATISATVTASGGVDEANKVEASVTASFTVGSSATHSRETSTTFTRSVEETVTFTASPMSHYEAVAIIEIVNLPSVQKTITGKFYYTSNLPGSEFDKESGLYRLDVPIDVVIAGATGVDVSLTVDETPIAHVDQDADQLVSS